MNIFLQIVLILLSARLFGEIAQKLSIPAVIGELCAGIILGPSLLDLIPPTELIHLLAEIGVVLLLFEIGIETNVFNLLKVGPLATLAASFGIIVPFILGFLLSYTYFDLSLLLSLFVGGTLTATSIGITLRVMSEVKREKAHESQIILGAAIIDDIIGIALLAVLYEFSVTREIDLFHVGKVILFIIIFLLLSPILVKMMASLIERYECVSTIPGLLPTMTLSLLLFFAYLATQFGAPALMGGFATGLALSSGFALSLPRLFQTTKEFSERVEVNLKPIIHLFVPLFFVNIGLMLNLKEISWNSQFIWIFTSVILMAAILGKLSSGFVLFKEKGWVKWVVGLAMIPRGEVGLVFAEVGRSSGVFNQEIYASMTLVIAITTLLAPFALKLFYSRKECL